MQQAGALAVRGQLKLRWTSRAWTCKVIIVLRGGHFDAEGSGIRLRM